MQTYLYISGSPFHGCDSPVYNFGVIFLKNLHTYSQFEKKEKETVHTTVHCNISSTYQRDDPAVGIF